MSLAKTVTDLVRSSIENYLQHNKVMSVPREIPSSLLDNKGGVFVSLKKKGNLRGCIGTTEGFRPNLASEIINNAVSAGFRDPRFPPLQQSELDDLTVSVDMLSPPEKVNDTKELDHRRYGVLVKAGSRSGLLLPDLAGVDSVAEQLDIACQKAGIFPGEIYDIYRFTVTRYSE